MKSKGLKKDSFYYFALGWVAFESQIIFVLTFGLNRFGISKDTNAYQIVFYSIFALLFIAFLFTKKIKKRSGYPFILFVLFLVFAYINGQFNNPFFFTIDKSSFNPLIFLLYFPSVFFLFYSLKDFHRAEKTLIWFARVFCWVSILELIINYANSRNGNFYSMTLGYDLAFSLILLFRSNQLKKNIYDFFLFVASFLFVLLFGNRGAALTVIISIVLLYLFNKCENKSKSYSIKAVCAVLFIFVIVYLLKDPLINLAGSIANAFGVQSRTFEKLISGDIYDDNGRRTIQLNVMSSWDNMPFFGYGLLGDRQFAEGSYSHNLIIELITTFGFPLSIFIIFSVFLLLIAKINKYKECRGLLVVLTSFTITKMLFSGSFATETVFFIFLGCCFNYSLPLKKTVNYHVSKRILKTENQVYDYK